MSYRQMRMIIFFDLPVNTSEDRRNYRKFSKFLKINGFIMMQESVYSKLLLNPSAKVAMESKVRSAAPPIGKLFMMTITEKQYANIEQILGSIDTDIINNTERTLRL